MATATLDLEESSRKRGWLPQLAITLFLGIPMTLALTVGLVFYCIYECVKFAFFATSGSQQAAHSGEHAFTNSLTKFARIHGQTVKPASEPDAKTTENQNSPTASADTKN